MKGSQPALSGEQSTLLTNRSSLDLSKSWLARDAIEEELNSLSSSQLRRRRMYMAKPTAELLALCNDRGLSPAHANRRDVIALLEDDDFGTERWVQSRQFECLMLVIIILSAVATGVQIDRPEVLAPWQWNVSSVLFFAIFTLEIILKVSVLGVRKYFHDKWNVFDFCVTSLVAFKLFFCSHFGASYRRDYVEGFMGVDYTCSDFVQIVRLCRLFRLAKVFKELGILLKSFLSSLRAIGWIALLLVIWFYVAACVATIAIGRSPGAATEINLLRPLPMQGSSQGPTAAPPPAPTPPLTKPVGEAHHESDDVAEVRERFATIPLSMFALFEVMTLEGWQDYVRPFLHSQVPIVLFFIAFIFITAFFMLNLITAVVVDRTVAAQEQADQTVSTEQELQRQALLQLMHNILYSENAQSPDPNSMSREDFTAAIKHKDIREAMQELGASKDYMLSMFDLADADQSGEVNLDALHRVQEASHQPLDMTNYVKFQIGLANRLERQEKLIVGVLQALEQVSGERLELPDYVEQRMHKQVSASPNPSPRPGSPRQK